MQQITRKHVLVFAGGGLTPVSGGVGRLMRYMMTEWDSDPSAITVRVIDTRGEGLARSALAHFLSAVATLIAGRVTRQAACVHLHMTTRGSAARKASLCALSRALGLPVILHLHGADFFEFYAALPALVRRVLRGTIAGADCVIVIGAAWQARLVQELHIPAERIRVVLNGVPPAPRARPVSWPPHIVFLGRLGARKGVADLIAALACPAMAARSWTATIAGDGDGAPYHGQIDAAGLRARVRMPGWQSAAQTDALLGTATILVLPSHHEVMPLAVLEAMARGIAIVTTPVGCVPDILQDGVTARLVPPGAPPALAAALAWMIDCPADRNRMADAALDVFRQRLTVAATAVRIQSLYRCVGAPRFGRHQSQIHEAGSLT